LDVVSKLEGLRAMPAHVSAAPEDLFHSSRDQPLEAHFSETEARVFSAAGFQVLVLKLADEVPKSLHHGPHGSIGERFFEIGHGLVVETGSAGDADDYVH